MRAARRPRARRAASRRARLSGVAARAAGHNPERLSLMKVPPARARADACPARCAADTLAERVWPIP